MTPCVPGHTCCCGFASELLKNDAVSTGGKASTTSNARAITMGHNSAIIIPALSRRVPAWSSRRINDPADERNGDVGQHRHLQKPDMAVRAIAQTGCALAQEDTIIPSATAITIVREPLM